MHHCSACQSDKPLMEFYTFIRKDRGGRKQIRPYCKSCHREKKQKYDNSNREKVNAYHRAYRAEKKPVRTTEQRRKETLRPYNLRVEDYDLMLAQQNGTCAICFKGSTNSRRLHVDHCHETEKVQGLLCFRCNTALGGFNDDLDLLTSAMAYLWDEQEID